MSIFKKNIQDALNEVKETQSSVPGFYSDEFLTWLADNFIVYEAFEDSSAKVINVGYHHYSARTIIEVIRHQFAIREISGNYKINNNNIPDLARLFMKLHPVYDGFFEVREGKKRK